MKYNLKIETIKNTLLLSNLNLEEINKFNKQYNSFWINLFNKDITFEDAIVHDLFVVPRRNIVMYDIQSVKE